MDAVRIKKELRAHGASVAQAESYVSFVRKFERESVGQVAAHHILPRECGWWKRYQHCRWNLARVDWGKHIALHAYLFSIFPDNKRLLKAIRAAALGMSVSPKKDRYKQRVIQWYVIEKKEIKWIAKKIDADQSII